MAKTLVDTQFVIALVNSRDKHHGQAVRLAHEHRGRPLLVTDAVLLEIGNALARDRREDAVAVIESFLDSRETEVVNLTPDLFERAFALYSRRQDKTWSLVDCVSFVVMTDRGLQQALTSDRHFTQAGFQALLLA
jgi:hypothetical protein